MVNLIGAVALCAACTSPGGTAGTARLPVTAPANAAVDAQINAIRADAGRGAVGSNAALDAIAQSHAADMVARGYFSHTAPGGNGFADRLRAAGVRACAAAENIAVNGGSASDVVRQWMRSEGHRANILNPAVNAYGVGQAGDHWVLVLVGPC